MLLMERKAEKFTGERWEPVVFSDLKRGDIFRLFESDGTPVDGGEACVAHADAVLRDLVWGIEVKSPPMSPSTHEALLCFQADPFKYGAACVLDKPVAEVTKEERHRFKQAAFQFFFWRAPDILRCYIDEGAGVAAEDLKKEFEFRRGQGEPF
jgi:hypothetical protein